MSQSPFLAMLTFLTVVAASYHHYQEGKKSMLYSLGSHSHRRIPTQITFFLMFGHELHHLYFLMGPPLTKTMHNSVLYCQPTPASGSGRGLLILSATVDTSTPTISELASSVVTHLDPDTQWWIFLAIFVGCSLRIPLFPFHIWLRLMISKLRPPAGILLVGGFIPLGVYTLLRFALAVLPDAVAAFTLVLAAAGIVNMLFCSLAALVTPNRQHKASYYVMGYTGTALLGMATLTVEGISGAFYTILSLGAAITFSLTLTYLTSNDHIKTASLFMA